MFDLGDGTVLRRSRKGIDQRPEARVLDHVGEAGFPVPRVRSRRFFAESVLADQAWIHDDSLTVGKALAEQGADVVEFVRYALAE